MQAPTPAGTATPGSRTAASPIQRYALAGTAASAFLCVLARAAIQSITIDEADTYLDFVAGPAPSHWQAAANNHVLNSLLTRLSTTLFGVSELTVRMPALLGAAIYIGAALQISKLLPAGRWLRWCLLVSLTCNPFVMDYLVAARGYSLALGFLLASIALAAHPLDVRPDAVYRRCALCSLCAGLSFAANFSFALADASVLLLCALWLVRRTGLPAGDRRLAAYAKALAASSLPGIAVALLITESALFRWTRGNLYFGATSLIETIRSVMDSSLYRPNRYLLSPAVYKAFVFCGPYLFPALGIACAFRLATIAIHRPKSGGGPRLAVQLAWFAGAAVLLSLGLHWLLYRFSHVYLPLGRTALFFAPLAALFTAALAAIPAASRPGHAARRLLLAAVTAMSLYFLSCLRLTYFRDWDFDADVKHVYAVLTSYNRTYGLTDVCSNWRYVSALKFYRAASGPEPPGGFSLDPPVDADYQAGKQIYVIFRPFGQPFIDRQHLAVVYEDAQSGVAVAIPPGVLARPSEPRP